jgi:hypothetical protein
MELSGNSYIVPRSRRAGASFFAQLGEVSSCLRWTDILFFALILGFGVLQFFCSEQAPDFLADNVKYSDSGRDGSGRPWLPKSDFCSLALGFETDRRPTSS